MNGSSFFDGFDWRRDKGPKKEKEVTNRSRISRGLSLGSGCEKGDGKEEEEGRHQPTNHVNRTMWVREGHLLLRFSSLSLL